MQRTDLVQENKALRQQVNRVNHEKNELQRDNDHFRTQLRTASFEISNLEGRILDLKDEIANIYQSTKAFLKEHTGSVQAFKSTLKEFVSKVKERLPGGEFERLNKQEKRKEMDRGMER